MALLWQFPKFYPILDTFALEHRQLPAVEAAEALLEAGVRILQFRHKRHFSRDILDQAEKIARLCDTAKAALVINDRADVARLLGAGLHLGQEDLTPAAARGLMGSKGFIGYSTHNAAQLQAADREPVDYLAIGPVFATGSKENPDPVVGVEALAGMRNLTRKPLVAIGGITLDNAAAVFQAGIDSLAVIGALLPRRLPERSPESGSLLEMRRRAEQWLRATRDMV